MNKDDFFEELESQLSGTTSRLELSDQDVQDVLSMLHACFSDDMESFVILAENVNHTGCMLACIALFLGFVKGTDTHEGLIYDFISSMREGLNSDNA